jgi:HD-GYP domain-containing protein (c-di-GMP phosphodiesterase class II)
MAAMRSIGSGHTPLHRFRIGLEFVVSGHRDVDGMIEHHAAMGRRLGEELELPQAVLDALTAGYERWDGRGWPGDLGGDAVPVAARLAGIAEFVEVAHRVGGIAAARTLVRERSGGHFDPHLCELLDAEAEVILGDLDGLAAWDAVIGAEPALGVMLSGEAVDRALRAIANFVDLKSPFFLGHAQGVAELAEAGAARLGLDPVTMRRAGLMHDLGRLGVSNAIWDKSGPLAAGEWERVRFQPYMTERMLRQSDALAPLAAIAVAHRERLDGTGYPRGLTGASIAAPARLLAAADAYQAMREPRPHRAALSAEAAAETLRADVRAGRIDADAAEAVLGAAGHRITRRREGPAGLTAREVEVLRLLARGLSNKEIAALLTISPKTVANHAEHIYAKIDAPTRAAAGLYAMQHGLLPEESLPF